MKRLLAPCLLAAALPAALAQTIAAVKVEPPSVQAGEPVTITATFDDASSPNCNVRVHFGDGASQDFKINQAKDVPLVTRRTYAKPGTYTVRVEGKTALPVLKCLGQTKSALVSVLAPPPPPPLAKTGAAAAPAGAPACPSGWTLDAKSVNRKTGAFTCSAKPGATLPLTRLDCPGTLSYFENQARAQLGCRP